MTLLVINLSVAQEKRLKEDVTCEQAMQLIQEHKLDSGFVILDVRTPDEFNAGHLEKAVNVDFKAEDFKVKLETLDKSKIYLVYCRRGVRSASTIGMMNALNFKALFHLYEGYDVWKGKGNTTVQ
jgi:rhodanese-related sulfurtransferase